MKKIAALLLCIFVVIQSGSVVSTLLTDATSVYVIDENKDVKYNIENIFLTVKTFELHRGSKKGILLIEKIRAAPCLEKLIPPPDFI